MIITSSLLLLLVSLGQICDALPTVATPTSETQASPSTSPIQTTPTTTTTTTNFGFFVVKTPEYMGRVTPTPKRYDKPTTEETVVVAILLVLALVVAVVMTMQFKTLFVSYIFFSFDFIVHALL